MIAYNDLMKKVSQFITNPGNKDEKVSEIFSDSMFNDLVKHIKKTSDWPGIDEMRTMWTSDFKNRKIISEFIKDPLLGKKRLISMLDRVTNTINVVGSDRPATRPAVINCYDGKTLDGSVVTLESVATWWPIWLDYMFGNSVNVPDNENGERLSEEPYIKCCSQSKSRNTPA